MGMVRGNFSSKLFIEGLREVFFDELSLQKPMYTELFDVQKSTHQKEYDHSVTGIGMLEEKEEGLPLSYEDFTDGFDVTYTNKTFAKGIRLTEELEEDSMYGIMSKRTKALANAATYRKEYDHASIFNNANNTNVFTGGDGVALLSASHPLAGVPGVTASNLSTSDLSLSALETAFTSFRRMVNDKNLLVAIDAATLLIPPESEFDAMEILNSSGKPYTADNEINALKGRLKVKVWPFLTDTDCWFILSDKRYGAPISFNRVPISMKTDGDFDTGDLKIKARTRYCYGFSDWRWCYGSLGAA